MRERYDGTIQGRAGEIAKSLGLVKWQVIDRAVKLGLTRGQGKPWTADEEAFLWTWAGRKTVTWMANKLGREKWVVIRRMRVLGIRRAVVEGYTQRELMRCFGVCDHTLRRWVKQRMLRVSMRGTANRHDPWQATDAQVLRFIERHPEEIDLRKVDQIWFLDIVTNGGLISKALEAEVALEAAGARLSGASGAGRRGSCAAVCRISWAIGRGTR